MSDNVDLKASGEDRADQWMRETMSGHRVEPAPKLWKGISRKLLWRELLRFNFTNLPHKFWIAGVTGLMLVSTLVYVGWPENDFATRPGTVTTPSVEVIKTAASQQTATNPTTPNKSLSDVGTPAEMAVVRNVHSEPAALASNSSMNKPYLTRLSGSSRIASTNPGSAGKQKFEENTFPTYFEQPATADEVQPFSSALSRLHALPAGLLALPAGPDTLITINTSAGILKFRKTRQIAPNFFSVNLGLTPEMAFYQEPDAYSRMNYWLNGGITWHISKYSLATGFSLGYVFDQGKYNVEYKSNDSIGYFTGVTSYTVGPGNEILFNTQTVNVYDSLDHAGDYRTKNRYTYVQIPLLAGYRLFESGRFSLTFQAGPAVSLLLGSRKADPVIEYANARIVRVDDDTPTRVTVNWQVWANLYCEMRLTRKIGIYLEPSFKYYLKPMVTSEDINYKAPWTIGLGVGIQFNFGNKSSKP